MLVVIRPDLLVAVETQRDTVVEVIGTVCGLIDDMSGFNVEAALLVAQAAMPMAACEHLGLYRRFEGHREKELASWAGSHGREINV